MSIVIPKTLFMRAVRSPIWIPTIILIALHAPAAVATTMMRDREAAPVWPFPDTTEYYVRVLWWGEGGSEPGQFDVPFGMGSDRQGNVYVCDNRNHRVQKFDSLGSFLMMFGEEGTGPGQFEFPMDVAVDAEGYIYVTDYDSWDWNPSWVHKFDSLGNFVLRWGGEAGLEPGQLRAPTGIAVGDSRYVYVADSGDRIQRFTGDGDFDMYWTYPNPEVHGGEVVTTYPGSVYTRWAPGYYCFFRHDPVGNIILAFPPGPCPGHLPQDLATDSEGNLFVAVWGPYGQVSKYDSLGALIVYWPTNEEIYGIAADAHDAIYVAHYTENVISKWERRVVGVREEPFEPFAQAVSIGVGWNYPNPFSASTTIPCVVSLYPVEGGTRVQGADPTVEVRIVVYDVLGQVVRTLVDGRVPLGMREVVWDGTDDAGQEIGSGIYFVRLDACGETATQKVVLIR